jgi:pimeloyl-ACP methyl ester carboxylesterase
MRINGVDLHVEQHGAGNPILCVHGTSSSAMAWEGAVEPLARLGRVITYDRRGCTRSERPEPYERVDVAEHAGRRGRAARRARGSAGDRHRAGRRRAPD